MSRAGLTTYLWQDCLNTRLAGKQSRSLRVSYNIDNSMYKCDRSLFFAQVVKGDGITTILTGPDSQIAAEPSINSSAVKDSLDTLAGIAVSSQEGRIVCLESSAGPAACSALQVHLQPVRYANIRFKQLSKPPFHQCFGQPLQSCRLLSARGLCVNVATCRIVGRVLPQTRLKHPASAITLGIG